MPRSADAAAAPTSPPLAANADEDADEVLFKSAPSRSLFGTTQSGNDNDDELFGTKSLTDDDDPFRPRASESTAASVTPAAPDPAPTPTLVPNAAKARAREDTAAPAPTPLPASPAPATPPEQRTVEAQETSVDDIFASAKSRVQHKLAPTAAPTGSVSKTSSKSAAEDDVDDIFNTTRVTKAPAPRTIATDVDDDIFANVTASAPVLKKPTPLAKKRAEPAPAATPPAPAAPESTESPAQDPLSDAVQPPAPTPAPAAVPRNDDTDIFASTSAHVDDVFAAPPAAVRVELSTEVDSLGLPFVSKAPLSADIFGDDDFAAPATKKRSKKATATPDIFAPSSKGGDEEDIFGGF